MKIINLKKLEKQLRLGSMKNFINLWMGEALKIAQQDLLKKKNKFMVFGQGVSSDGYGLKKIAPHKVIEMPISEVAFSGMAVGLASQGFRPLVHHIRTEFSLLVLARPPEFLKRFFL